MFLISKNNNYRIFIFLLIFISVIYGNTLQNYYNIDDTYVTQNNPIVQKGISGIPKILTERYVDEEGNSFGYRPMATVTYAIEYQLWVQNPNISHLINTLLFALCAMLLFLTVRKIFPDTNHLFTLAIVFLFAAHPIHTEVVASLKNRETLLSFLFSLVSLHLFLKWYDVRKAAPVVVGVFAFVIAFLSKQDAITFAAVIPLALFYYSGESLPEWLRLPRQISQEQLFNLVTFSGFLIFWYVSNHAWPWITAVAFFTVIFFLLFRYFRFTRKREENPNKPVHRLFLFAGFTFTLLSGIFSKNYFALFALVCFAVFFLRFFDKFGFSFGKLPKTITHIVFPLATLSFIGILIYKLPNLYLPPETKTVYNFENPQFSNHPDYPTIPLAFYTLFFYLKKLIWPHPLGFYYGYKMIPEVSWLMPEVIFSVIFHVGIFIWAIYKLPKKHILSFAILYYLVTISIFTNIVIKIPGIVGERLAFFPSLGFCIALAWGIFKLLKIPVEAQQIPRKKRIQLVVVLLLILIPYSVKTITRNTHWKDYLTLYSHDIGYLANSAKANNMYANQLLKEAFNNEIKNPAPEKQEQYLNLAFTHIRKAVEIDSTFKFAWNNLGFLSQQYKGNSVDAVKYLKKALNIDPNYADAHFNLGVVYKETKQFELAEIHLKKAARLKPGKFNYLVELGETYFRQAEYNKAIKTSQKAAILNPESELPYVIAGNSYWLKTDTLNAIKNWEKAFELNPTNLNLCRNLAGYYQSVGSEKARYYHSKATELQKIQH